MQHLAKTTVHRGVSLFRNSYQKCDLSKMEEKIAKYGSTGSNILNNA